jgi:membrane-bound lytic murein transglycosylase F
MTDNTGAQAAAVSETTSPHLAPPLEKLAPYAQIIAEAAQETQLPFWLVCAVIAQESDFEPQEVSPVGATGLMQIMPATARSCRVSPDVLTRPEVNVRLGCRIFADLRDTFRKESGDDRLKFALAAYNGGIGYVLNAQALATRNGLNPAYWPAVARMLPETRVYYMGRWREPDYRQITEYVERIWERYAAWRDQPLPTAAETQLAQTAAASRQES